MTLVQAYITAGATVIPCLPPGPQEREHARRLGIDENDLFGVDVPCGMTRWTRGSFLIASTQVSALYAAATVRLDLNDGSGGSLAIRNLYYTDYGKETGRGILLASYTWSEDAQRWGSRHRRSPGP